MERIAEQIQSAKTAEELLLRHELVEEAATLRGLIERAIAELPGPVRTSVATVVLARLLFRFAVLLTCPLIAV